MSTESLAQPARTTTTHDQLAERIEAELTRIERARPQLAETARKAANILVSHLAGRPRMQVVRVRISKTGKHRFLFTSLTGNGATYVVDPASWSCSCPAAHRYEGACKHALSAWVLSRSAERQECAFCYGTGKVWIGESTTNEAGEEVELVHGVACRRCHGRGTA